MKPANTNNSDESGVTLVIVSLIIFNILVAISMGLETCLIQ